MTYSQKGFSFVEVMVASLIIMLGVTGYVKLQTQYVIADKELSYRHIALQIAQQKADDLLFFHSQFSYSSFASFEDIQSNAGGQILSGKITKKLSNSTNEEQQYQLTWQVENMRFIDTDYDQTAETWVNNLKTNEPVNLKKVHVQVVWLDAKSQKQQLNIQTFVAPNSLMLSFPIFHKSQSVDANLL